MSLLVKAPLEEVLGWALNRGCLGCEVTWAAATEAGHLEALQRGRKQHCDWDEMTCAYPPLRAGTWRC